MRGNLLVVVVGLVLGGAGSASAEPVKPSCAAASSKLADTLHADAKSHIAVARRCEQDGWSAETKACFAASQSPLEATLCLDTLSKKQRIAIEGDADRLADRRLARWLLGRAPSTTTAPVTQVTFASFNATIGANDATPVDLARARTLQKQAMTAYQAGKYELASKTFSAAVEASPTPDNIYFAAQSFRMKGSRARALELYERYLEIAPNGPAASTCRLQIERLRDAIP